MLYEAVSEGRVGCQKFRLARKDLAQQRMPSYHLRMPMAGFGGHLGNMVCPRKIMADGEAQKFEWLHLFKWVVFEADRRICQTVLSERQGYCVRFVGVERYIPSVGPTSDSTQPVKSFRTPPFFQFLLKFKQFKSSE